VLLGIIPEQAGAQATYRLGLDFIETPVEAPYVFWWPPSNPEPGFFEPYPITDPSTYFITEGGLAGWTEEQVRRGIALRTEDAFRAIDTGDPDTTVRVAIHLGRVPQSLQGHRFNVAMCESSSPSLTYWGLQAAAPQDGYTAAVYLDEIDDEPSLIYDTAERALNVIVGTTAHEIGHVFVGPAHIPAGDSEPYALMAIESTGLPTWARLTVRRLCQQRAVKILAKAGTVNRADFDISGAVDTLDITTLVAGFGRTDALFQEGDATGDHRVDVMDITALVSGFGIAADPGPPEGGAGTGQYEPRTGEPALDYLDGFGKDALAGEATVIPEPGSVAMLAGGLLGLLLLLWRRRRRS